jgi:3-methyladenine DNA glycosylase AlkD
VARFSDRLSVMPTTQKTMNPPAKATAKIKTPSPAARTKAKSPAVPKASPKAKGETMALPELMKFLEKSGSEQTRKTYTRHGAKGPMFGVSFATLSTLQKRIRVDHDLALKLWKTGNVDARNLAMKIADPAAITPSELDRWAVENPFRMCALYIGSLAQESGHGPAKAKEWLASSDETLRATGWTLISVLANRDDQSSDDTYAKQLAKIEKSIRSEANDVKSAMNGALIAIGGRSPALRKAATAAAKRIGRVEVDHGATACETPDAVPYIDKAWARLQGKFPTPAAAERARESMRTRC